ncbi:uncharacterized protein PHA67_013867 isoform 1-T1 [Liasis olivaceus]
MIFPNCISTVFWLKLFCIFQLNSNTGNQGHFHSSICPRSQGSNPVSRDFRKGSAERPSGSSKVPGNPPLNASLDNLAPRLVEMERLQQLAILRARTRAAVYSTLSADDRIPPRTDRQQTKQPRPLDRSARCQAKINAEFRNSRRGGQERNSKSTKSPGMLSLSEIHALPSLPDPSGPKIRGILKKEEKRVEKNMPPKKVTFKE